MALTAPASLFWSAGPSSGPCRDGSNEVRHARNKSAVVVRRKGQQWERCQQSCSSSARVTGVGGDMNKRDAARKALEAALGEKKAAFSKWDEEIKKREEGGGGGGGGGRDRGRGWGSGGGGSSGGGQSASNSNSWEEAKQMVLAFFGLAALYLVLTQGKSMLAFSVNSILYVLRGFKSSSSSARREPALSSPIAADGLGPAESSVISKWGKD